LHQKEAITIENLEERAAQFHEKTFLIELHCDYPVDLVRRKRKGEKQVMERLWLPRMRRGGVNASNMIVGGDTLASGKTMDEVLEALCYFQEELAELPDVVAAASVAEIEAAFRSGKIAVFFGLEGAGPLGTRITNLRMAYQLGVRLVQPTWNARNLIADGCKEEVSGGGLTSYGREFIREMNRLGMIIDLSHLSERGVEDILAVSSQPVVWTHSNCRALCDHPRNITDEVMKRVADKGGMIGVVFYPLFLRTDGKWPNIDDVLRHIDHMLKVVGEDHIGLGPDFINFSPELIHQPPIPCYPERLESVDDLPNLTVAMMRHGYKENTMEKIMGRNFLRVAKDIWGA